MRRTIMLGLLICLIALPAMAISYSGSLEINDATLKGTGAWVAPKTELKWTITEGVGVWNYDYKFEVAQPCVNFFILEVTPDFTTEDIFNLTVNGISVDESTLQIGLFTPSDYPGMPGGEIFGIKFEGFEELEECDEIEIIFDSERAPVWGDMYSEGATAGDQVLTKKQLKAAKKAAKLASKLASAKPGLQQVKLEKKLKILLDQIGENGTSPTNIWNKGFLTPDPSSSPPANGYICGHLLRPDSEPEEPTGDLEIFKFEDLNGNGVADAGEAMLAGWEFNVTGPDSFNQTAVTGADGKILFAFIEPGLYTITETVQADWVVTTPNPQTVEVFENFVTSVYFGNQAAIPEPAGLMMLGLGAILLRRRRA